MVAYMMPVTAGVHNGMALSGRGRVRCVRISSTMSTAALYITQRPDKGYATLEEAMRYRHPNEPVYLVMLAAAPDPGESIDWERVAGLGERSPQEIADELGVTRQAVHRACACRGIVYSPSTDLTGTLADTVLWFMDQAANRLHSPTLREGASRFVVARSVFSARASKLVELGYLRRTRAAVVATRRALEWWAERRSVELLPPWGQGVDG